MKSVRIRNSTNAASNKIDDPSFDCHLRAVLLKLLYLINVLLVVVIVVVVVMEVFIAAGYRGKDLILLNVMRMSIKAITVADISTADGLRLAHSSVLMVYVMSMIGQGSSR